MAVTDLAHLFPTLPDTLDRLNAAQEVFDFVSVEITVPLCAWSLHPMKPNGSKESYLYADRFAKQLATKPRELGASFLACITHRPLVCDTSKGPLYNVYAWWPDPAEEPTEEDPLLIFSTYGFTIPPQGPITDRVLTNGFVTCLAGSLLNADTHEHGPKDCPLYLNPERDFGHLAGSLRFHDGCRKKLAAKYPRELEAFDAMLTVCPEA